MIEVGLYTQMYIVCQCTNLFVEMTDPFCKLSSIGDCGREKDVVNIVWQKNDSLFPNHTSLYSIKKKNDKDGIRTHACRAQWISSPSP